MFIVAGRIVIIRVQKRLLTILYITRPAHRRGGCADMTDEITAAYGGGKRESRPTEGKTRSKMRPADTQFTKLYFCRLY